MLLTLILLILVLPVIATMLFMRQASFGKLPSGKRLERIHHSPQYRNGSFHNQSLTPPLTEGVSMLTVMRDFFFGKHERKRPAEALPVITTDLKQPVPALPQLTWFGHSSYLLQVNGLNILVDPVFSQRTSPVQYAGTKAFAGVSVFTVADLPQIDILLLTHDHYDHLDYGTLLQLKDKAGTVVTSLGVGAHLEYWGIPAAKIRELDWWDTTAINDTTRFTATPARHFSGRGFKRNQTLWSSFVLEAGDYRFYLGGDSGYDSHFKAIGERFGPFDLAILEDGQYNPYWAHIHMMPEETAQAAVDLHARVLFPVHWGKFALATHPWDDSIRRVLKRADTLKVKVITPQIGERISLDGQYHSRHWWEGLA
ncbi:MBL fold metallo-hydrolase [Taibaiella koreensis]|uniref:MBL fold metallo-hydrolase n=1 Tax=Taibaiella koreensis TaxID=1268548 RepID=UPI000E59B098|nr:MBL fold metallo-hydrolase [Taibaiella koreensis]